MRKFLFTLSALIATTVSAGAITISGGAGAWREKPSGWLEYTKNNVNGTGISATTKVDVKDDLHLSDKTKPYGWVKISDIPIPLFPDIKLRYTPMKFSGSGYAKTTFTFGNITVPAGTKVESKFRANQADIILTYNFPFVKGLTAQKLNLQWGLNLKVIDGYAKVKYLDPTTGTWKEDSKSATIPAPMLHLEGEVRPIELAGISFEGNWIGYAGNQFYDWLAEFKVYPMKHLFLGVGYRYQRLKVDDVSDFSCDIKVKGAFGELGFQF
ncbi:TIGR04219 family outer membrane beta-barrel protein [Thermovibrio sp.]